MEPLEKSPLLCWVAVCEMLIYLFFEFFGSGEKALGAVFEVLALVVAHLAHEFKKLVVCH